MPENKYDKTLGEVLDIFGEDIMPFSGTLLWAFRDGYQCDSPGEDLDFFLPAERFDAFYKHRERLRMNGFVAKKPYLCPVDAEVEPYEKAGISVLFYEETWEKNGVPVNLYYASLQDGYRLFVYLIPGTRIHSIRRVPESFFTDTIITHKGQRMKIPYDTEGCLELLYGKDWMVHKPDFDKSSPPCEWKRVEI